MEFHEKIQELRKQKGLTQEELAESLYVSRTAISKWESGRGYPNIDSLKAIAKFFCVTIDDLLSGEELLTIAQEDAKQNAQHIHDLVFGLMDCSFAMFFFLPLFGQHIGGMLQEVSLLSLTALQPWLKIFYYTLVIAMVLLGILRLALQNSSYKLWLQSKQGLSLLGSTLAVFLFIVTRQPYAAGFAFLFLVIKALMLLKKQ